MKKFIAGRIKAVFYSLNGAFHLLKTEHSIQAQTIISVIFIFLGFYFKISPTEWMFKILAIALILSIESLNTAVEKICDYIHPDHNKKIGIIKDISAGAAFFAFIYAFSTVCYIYYPILF